MRTLTVALSAAIVFAVAARPLAQSEQTWTGKISTIAMPKGR